MMRGATNLITAKAKNAAKKKTGQEASDSLTKETRVLN
jgi:hypothetical protein